MHLSKSNNIKSEIIYLLFREMTLNQISLIKKQFNFKNQLYKFNLIRRII